MIVLTAVAVEMIISGGADAIKSHFPQLAAPLASG